MLVRDQEVGGSNPLAPTKFLKDLQSPNDDIRVRKASVFRLYSDPDVALCWSLFPYPDQLAVRRLPGPLADVPGGLVIALGAACSVPTFVLPLPVRCPHRRATLKWRCASDDSGAPIMHSVPVRPVGRHDRPVIPLQRISASQGTQRKSKG